MSSLLDSKLKELIAKGFKGRLSRGTLRRSAASGLDSAGDPTNPTVTSFTFEGIRATWSAYYKANSGIPETDVSILILQGSLNPATTITGVDEGAKIFMGVPWNKWYQVRRVLRIDPAGASAELQCYECPAP